MDEHTQPIAKVYEIESFNQEYDGDGNSVMETHTATGYLAATEHFVGLTDSEGRVTFFMPTCHVYRIVSTGDAETSGPVN